MSRRGENIYKRKDGRWEGRFLDSYDQFGNAKYHSVYAKSYTEVKKKLGFHKKRNISTASYKSLKLAKYCADWLEAVKFKHKESTYSKYRNMCKNHIMPELGGYDASLISGKQIENFLSMKLNEENLSPKTVNDILCVLKLIFSSESVAVKAAIEARFATVAIQQFYQEKAKNGRLDRPGGLSAKTLRNMHNMLHKALNQAVYLDMISKNPADFVVLPKKKKAEMRYFTVEEQQKLQEVIKGNRLEMPILLDLYTGVRQGELFGLIWRNVHIDLNGNSYIRITQTLNRIRNPDKNADSKTILAINEPKTKHSVRNIPLLPNIAEKLNNYRKSQSEYLKSNGYPESDFVFTSTTGTPIEPRCFQRDFKKILVKNNIRIVNVHGLRHTFATRALESGRSVKTLSSILGHSSTAFTMDVYGHVTEDLKIDEITKMNGFL